jgi:hypothetical protein
MMGDRELLELAAKAAGLVIDKSPHNGGGRGNTGFDASGNAVLDWHNGKTWNPLTDDGDALRLAVKLDLLNERAAFTYELALQLNQFADTCAATRRAIVRAAAEIGKAVEQKPASKA